MLRMSRNKKKSRCRIEGRRVSVATSSWSSAKSISYFYFAIASCNCPLVRSIVTDRFIRVPLSQHHCLVVEARWLVLWCLSTCSNARDVMIKLNCPAALAQVPIHNYTLLLTRWQSSIRTNNPSSLKVIMSIESTIPAGSPLISLRTQTFRCWSSTTASRISM